MNRELHNSDPRDRGYSNSHRNWDEEEYYEFLIEQYDQQMDEEEDIQGDL